MTTGIVHWAPPQSALDAAARLLKDPSVSGYGACNGLPELVAALEQKVDVENGLPEASTPHVSPLMQFIMSCPALEQMWLVYRLSYN